MAYQKITPNDKVPLLQKAAFGAGHLVNNLLPEYVFEPAYSSIKTIKIRHLKRLMNALKEA